MPNLVSFRSSVRKKGWRCGVLIVIGALVLGVLNTSTFHWVARFGRNKDLADLNYITI